METSLGLGGDLDPVVPDSIKDVNQSLDLNDIANLDPGFGQD